MRTIVIRQSPYKRKSPKRKKSKSPKRKKSKSGYYRKKVTSRHIMSPRLRELSKLYI